MEEKRKRYIIILEERETKGKIRNKEEEKLSQLKNGFRKEKNGKGT